MSKDLVTATIDSSIKDCAKLMKENGISSIVIVNSRGKLAGVVTKTDLVGTFLVQSTATLEISKVMTKKVITTSPEDSIFEVESLLFNNNIRRVVVQRKNHLWELSLIVTLFQQNLLRCKKGFQILLK